MAYPSRTSHRSFGGGCLPTYLASSIPLLYSAGQTFTVGSASTWYEIDENGDITANPLGTSGPFTLVIESDLDTEEKILCSAVNVTTGVVTVWTDGTLNGRGDDGSPIFAHSAGSAADLNVYPADTATSQLQMREGVIQAIANAATAQSAANTAEGHAQTALTNAAAAQLTANTAEGHAQTALTNAATAQSTANTALANAATAQSTANAKVASVTAGDSTVTIGGTSTAPTVAVTPNTFDAYGAAATKVASVTAGNATITIGGTSTAPTVAVNQSNLTIAESQVTNLTTDLAAKVNTSSVGAANGVASLDGSGLVPSSQIPPIAITETFVVASQAAMLALTAQVGDVAVRTDINNTFILQSAPASTLANWIQILTPADGVTSITASSPLTGGTITSTGTIGIQSASTSQSGAVQLTDSTSSTSTSTAATPNSVKTAYDLASTANSAASTAQSTANSKVASVTAGDTSITIAGTSTAPTVAVNQANLTIAESQVTNLVTDLSGKTPTSRTISTTAPLSGGGDLSANRTLSIADASTTVKGAVQLTDSVSTTSSTLAGTATAVKSAYDLANAALPKSGGTMSGAIAMGTNRITGLSAPGAVGDALRAGDFSTLIGPRFHSNAFAIPVLAWTVEPQNAGAASGPTSNRTYWQAIYIPYAMTVTGVVFSVSTIGSSITSSSIGLYDSTGTRLVQQSNANAGFGTASTGTVTVAFANTYSITTPGAYWIGFHVQATTTPTLIRGQSANAAAVNININAAAGTLNFRSGYSGTGAIPATFPAGTPTLDVAPWLFGLY